MTNNYQPNMALRFLYNTAMGRCFLKGLVSPAFSKFIGRILDGKISKILIPSFIKKNNIEIDDFEKREYKSYNDFFTRKGAKGFRTIDMSDEAFISPCDSALMVHRITAGGVYRIKNSLYTIKDLLRDADIADEYNDGYIMIFRLAVNNYHRYCFLDDCSLGKRRYINGVLNTVQPIAFNSCNVFSENCREYTVLETRNFGKVIQCEVGAMIVGKINNKQYLFPVRRGQAKGKFEFGGSTIIVLVKKDMIKIRKDIAIHSVDGLETNVLIGEKIAQKF